MLFVRLQLLFVFFGSGLCMEQILLHKQAAKYLPDSVIARRDVESELECSVFCRRYKGCLSVNYKVSGLGQGLCELNNKTISDKVAVTDDHFVYLGIAVWVYISFMLIIFLLETYRFFILNNFLQKEFMVYICMFKQKHCKVIQYGGRVEYTRSTSST